MIEPSLSRVICIALLRRLRHARRPASMASLNAALDFGPEVPDQSLDWPSGRIAERADGVAFDLFSDFQQLVNFRDNRITNNEPIHHAAHPACAFAAGRALA